MILGGSSHWRLDRRPSVRNSGIDYFIRLEGQIYGFNRNGDGFLASENVTYRICGVLILAILDFQPTTRPLGDACRKKRHQSTHQEAVPRKTGRRLPQ